MKTILQRLQATLVATITVLAAAGSVPNTAQAYHFFQANVGGGCRWAAIGPGNLDYQVDGSSTPELAAGVLADAMGAHDQWNGVETAQDVFGNFTTSATDFTGANFGTAWGIGVNFGGGATAADGQYEVVLDEDGSALAVFGLDPASINGFGPSREDVAGGQCTITDAFLLLNGTRNDYHRPSTAVHELGHTLGFAHSSVGEFNSENTTAFNGGFGSPTDALSPININNVPTMHPFGITGSARATIEDDDRAAISRRYPNEQFPVLLGTITGNVRRCSDDTPVSGVNVRAINTSTGAQISRYTAFDSNTTGRFELSVPPGTYNVVVEEMGHNGFNAGRMAINTAVDQGFPFEYYGPTAESELACDEDESDAPLGVAVTGGNSSDIQIRLNDGVRLAFVVDDTGSMSGEISAVRQILTNIIDNRIAAGGPFPRTTIVTFKDNVTRRIVSNLPANLQAVVNSLSAGGGGDCPESSNSALMTAGRILARGGKAILFTDADSRPDGPDRGSVVTYYRSRSLSMSTLLSATCSESFPSYRDRDATGIGARKAPRTGQDETAALPSGWTTPQTLLARALTPSASRVRQIAEEFAPPPMLGRESAFATNSGISQFTGGVFVALPRPNSADDRTRYINIGTALGLGSISSTVATLQPSALPAGSTAVVDVLGASTNFTSQSTLSFTDPAITVVSREVLSPSLIRARLSLGAALAAGFYDLQVATPLGSSVETAAGTGALQVTAAPDVPTLVGLSPNSAARGSSVNVTVFGNGTTFTADSAVSFNRFGTPSTSITVNSKTLVSPTELQLNLSLADDATTALYDLVVDSLSKGGGFSVIEAAPVVPTIVSLTPNTGNAGATGVVVQIVGENVTFTADSVASFGAGISVTGTELVDAQTLRATISIAADAAPGFRDVTVSTAGETAAILSGFQVIVPTTSLVSLSPASAKAGSQNLLLTITGTGFSGTPSVSISGDGVTVSEVTLVDATTITARVSLARDATAGLRAVSVALDETAVPGSLSFTVKARGIAGSSGLVLLLGLGLAAGLRRRRR